MNTTLLSALAANTAGEIFDLKGYAAVGMAGASLQPLAVEHTLKMPSGSELMYLPDRCPIFYNLRTGRMETVKENPFAAGEPIFPVAAFNSPGYMITYLSAYREKKNAHCLPLFAYGAVGWFRGSFRSAAVRVDREPRQDLRQMKRDAIVAGVRRVRKQMPANRLRAHLEKCALEYGCPAGKNFFLGRYEAPLPTAIHCNARCLGCLSLQQKSQIPCTQERIGFTPTPAEIAEVALAHIARAKNAIVSFGQGCEGDPLLAAHVIEPALHRIRVKTRQGTLNMNTNGSLPDTLGRLLIAGLDSVRISLNSVRKDCYQAYFRPQGYGFADVLKSIATALAQQKFVAINYLHCSGVTDAPEEVSALMRFLGKYPIHMIQWRNLNYDPLRYWQQMNRITRHSEPIGMAHLIQQVRRQFPNLKHGYFNPPKENFNLIKDHLNSEAYSV